MSKFYVLFANDRLAAMLCQWLSPSSAAFATLSSVVLAVSCGGSSDSGPPLATAGSGASASGGRAGAAGDSNGGATAVGGSGESADASGALSMGGAGAKGTLAGGADTAGGSTSPDASGASGRAGSAGSDGGAGTSSSSAGATNSSAGAGGAGSAGSVPTSDTFDGTTLDAAWTVFRPDLADIAVADGSLSITPHSGALWYQASQADLVYKLVTGNFKATTTVHARKASNPMQTPAQFADVGGIMARNPSGSTENYILGVVGYAEMNQLAVEHKSTTNGKSVYGEVAFTPDAEFRMCRVGSTFTVYYRHPGDTSWGPAFDPFERPDLPATVQVGAIAYTGASAPDFVATFASFTFEPLGAGCTQ
jgi:hypothetical protein